MDATQYFHQLSLCPLDAKGFLKKENIPKRGKLQLTLWYKQFSHFGLCHGIFIPPYESLTRGDIMGLYWPQAPDDLKSHVTLMSGHVLSALYGYDVFNDSLLVDKIGSHYAL
jgi:hypothetical protein